MIRFKKKDIWSPKFELANRDNSFDKKLILERTFDIKPNGNKYAKDIRSLALKDIDSLDKNSAKILKRFFLANVITDDHRKELWINKIGNKLKINKNIYLNLVARLNNQDFPLKTDKIIKDDLDRTLPVQNKVEEGSEIYEQIRSILKLFH